jgi:hypothetical protein
MADEQNPGAANNAETPAWIATFAGDNADMSKALGAFKTQADFYSDYTARGAKVAELEKASSVDWRKELAGDDEKEFTFLNRYATKQDYHKANVEARKRLSAGDFAKPLPADAKPEQVAEWRKANGIPEKPDQYFEKLPNGRVIGAEDKPMFDEVATALHGLHAQPAILHSLVEWYYGMADKETAALADTDKKETAAYEDAMRKAWGDDYRSNASHLSNWMEGLPEGVKKALDGFGADGRKFKNNPEMMQWLGSLAREFNPTGFVTPGGNEGNLKSIQDEITAIETTMRTKRAEYNKDEKLQARYRELITAREKMAKRVA